jgi:CRP-like cAMP-binding protein
LQVELQQLMVNAPHHIKAHFITKTYKKDESIIYSGEQNEHLYILKEGFANVYWQSYSGNLVTVFEYIAYSFFGENELFNEKLMTLNVVAVSDCSVIVLPRKIVHEWMKADFQFTLYLMEKLSDKLIINMERTIRLSQLSLKERLLYSLYLHYKTGDISTLDKETLMSETLAPIRSLNRVIAQCQSEGIISCIQNKFIILSVDKMEKIFKDIG